MKGSSREQKIIDEARRFAARELRPYANEFDQNESLPRELINKMAERGYLSATFPETYGGLNLDPVHYGLFTEQIGKACCSTRSLLTVHTSVVGETIIRWGTEGQKAKWLPAMARGEKIGAFALSEPNVGSDAGAVQTAYEKKKGYYIINGRKKWITFGEIADFFLVIASNNSQITAFVVEREHGGVATWPIKGMLGCRASHIAEIDLQNVEVSPENIVGQVGSGFPFVVSTALDHGRYSVAWAGVAIAKESLDAMTKYAMRRKQFGKNICSFQLIQGLIADAVTKTHAARALCLRAGELRKSEDARAVMETTIAKYFASEVAVEVARDAVQVHGAEGCSNSYPVERLFREAKVLEIIEGTSQIQQEIIARGAIRGHCQNKRN